MINTLLEKTSLVQGLRFELRILATELKLAREELHQKAPRPARFKLEAALGPEAIALHLAGTDHQPAIKAIMAHVGAKVVEASDRATDEPRETVSEGGRIIMGYSEEKRLYDSGRASAFAEILTDLQALTAMVEEAKPKATQVA